MTFLSLSGKEIFQWVLKHENYKAADFEGKGDS